MTPGTTTARARGWRFPALLLLALALLLAATPPHFGGDVVEYLTGTVALANHGTPDVHMDDVLQTRALGLPQLVEPLGLLEHNILAHDKEVYWAFQRAHNDRIYPVHFFGYSLLAVVPFKVLGAIGISPLHAFQVVNYAALFVLGLVLRRFFRSEARAWLGLLLFTGCGGALYLNWASPEFVSASCLLAALLLYLDRAPLLAGLLGGLASQQNPTIVAFFAFAPLLRAWLDRRAGAPAWPTRADVIGLAVGACVFALPPLFNLAVFGEPNIIAWKFSDRTLISGVRLASFFFDLNQGMILGIPGLVLLVLLWREGRREIGTLALCMGFTLALALPALSVPNWNSDAAGIMRYAFWSSMPLLLFVLLRLRAAPGLPRALLAGVGLLQAAAMAHAASYPYVAFSPLAKFVLAHAPGRYHPEPEIFAERGGNNDAYIWPDKVYTLGSGAARKTLYHGGDPRALELLCGPDGRLAPGNRETASAHGWRYIDGPVRCLVGGVPQQRWLAARFTGDADLRLEEGWSSVQKTGPAAGWGIWSDGPRSRIVLAVPPGPVDASLMLRGFYLEGNTRTRVRVNGADLGWIQLDRTPRIALPAGVTGPLLTIELEHENAHMPGPGDNRLLAWFLYEVALFPAPAASPSAG